MPDKNYCEVQAGACVLHRENNDDPVYLWVFNSKLELSLEDMQSLHKQLGLFIQQTV